MKYSRLVIRYLLVLATLGLTGLVNAEQQIYNINLPAQTVAQSLNALSQQTDIPVLFPYKLAEVQTANPIAGRYTLQQAVAIVLSGTGLSGGLSDKGVLMISHAESDTKNQGREAMKGNRKQLLATFIAVFGAGAVSSGVMAQDGIESATSQTKLDEIIVTAQKRTQSLQEVPISVQVTSGEFLEKINLSRFQDLQFITPGLKIDEIEPSNSDIGIRGVPNARSFLGIEPVVDTYWNGIAITPAMAFAGMFDLDRVEVLRGAQGALQGRPAPGGIIQLHSRRPDVGSGEVFSGRVRTLLSDDGDYELEAGGSAVIVPDKLAVRLSGLTTEDNGPVEYTNSSGQKSARERDGIRLSVAWEPTSDLRFNLVSQNNERTLSGNTGFHAGGNAGNALGVIDPYTNPRSPFEFDDFKVKHEQHTLSVEWDIDEHTITSLSGYGTADHARILDLDGSGTSDDIVDTSQLQYTERFVQELRIASKDRSVWDYMFGIYFLDSQFTDNTDIPAFSFDATTLREQEQLGIFMFHQFYLTDKWTAQAGLRWQNYERTQFSANNTSGRQDETASDTDGVTGSAQFLYQYSDDMMIYASYQRGFRPEGVATNSPGFDLAATGVIDPALIAYSSETSDAIELGVKSEFMDNRLQVNVNVYWQEISGLIGGTLAGVAIDANGDGIFTRNVNGDALVTFPTSNDAVSHGIELDWQALITPQWIFSGTLANNRVELEDGVVVPCTVFNAAGEITFPSGQALNFCDNSGRADEVPEWTLSMSTEYTLPNLLESGEGYVRVLYNYRDKRPTDTNTSIGDLGGFGTTNLYLGLRSANTGWDVSLWAENLTDKQALTYVNPSFNYQTAYPPVNYVAERRIGLSVNYTF